jgi:hypothetical protein
MPSYESRWEIIEELGEGGQGKVHRVRDKQACNSRAQIALAITNHIECIVEKPFHTASERQQAAQGLIESVLAIVKGERPEHQAVLKVITHQTPTYFNSRQDFAGRYVTVFASQRMVRDRLRPKQLVAVRTG